MPETTKDIDTILNDTTLSDEQKAEAIGKISEEGQTPDPTQPIFNDNPLFDYMGERTKKEQDAFNSGTFMTTDELKEEISIELTEKEIMEYAVMLIDAWTLGMIIIARGISLNTMSEEGLRPKKASLEPLYKVTAKLMYKYQKKAPLFFLFFLTLVMVYFPLFRDSYISRKQFKAGNLKKDYSKKSQLEVHKGKDQPKRENDPMDKFAGVKPSQMSKEDYEEFNRLAEIEQKARDEAKRVKDEQRKGGAGGRGGKREGAGGKKRGFDYSQLEKV